MDWQQAFLSIPEGSHTVRWAYTKDISFSDGQDAGWLDEVAFAAGAAGPDTLLSTSFNSGAPSGWTAIDYLGYDEAWSFDNPGGRDNFTGGTGGFAIADCDAALMLELDTALITPTINGSGYTNVALEFKTDFYVEGFAVAEIDLSLNGGSTWMNVWTRETEYTGLVTLSLPQAANRSNLRIRFHYTGYFDWWWQVDDVKVTGASLSSQGQGMLAEWRQAWEDYDRNYSYFTLKGVDGRRCTQLIRTLLPRLTTVPLSRAS